MTEQMLRHYAEFGLHFFYLTQLNNYVNCRCYHVIETLSFIFAETTAEEPTAEAGDRHAAKSHLGHQFDDVCTELVLFSLYTFSAGIISFTFVT